MAHANDYMVDVAGLRKQFQVRPERWGAKPRVVMRCPTSRSSCGPA